MNARNKIITVVIVMVLGITGTMLFFKLKPEAKQDTIFSFTSSPRVVNVMINDVDYGAVERGSQITASTTSNAEISISYPGFETHTAAVEVKPGETNNVEISLKPSTDEARDLLDDEKALREEQEVTESYLNTAEEAYKKFPILKKLPHTANQFSLYQGLPDSAGYEFGLHLYLYKGHEEQGRQAFTDWMKAQEFNVEEYNLVENIQDKPLPVAFPEPPTMRELEALTPGDIKIPANLSSKGLDANQLAQLFAVTTSTWDTAKDHHHSAAITRALPLMTKIEAGLVHTPEKPINSPAWRSAAFHEARSKSWITKYDPTVQKDGSVSATVKVCWAWIADDQEPKIDGPRTYKLAITNGTPAIAKYTYEDLDPFVDNGDSSCTPPDA